MRFCILKILPKSEERVGNFQQAYLGFFQTSAMEVFTKLADNFLPLPIFTKSFFVDVLQGHLYAFVSANEVQNLQYLLGKKGLLN